METLDFVIASESEDLKSETINELIKNYDTKKNEVPITITHKKTGKLKSWASFGWVKELARKGADLTARVEILPELKDFIKNGLLRKRSIGYFLKDGVAKLHHVAMLGAELPKIKGMPDIDLTYNEKENENYREVVFSEKKINGGSGMELTQEQLNGITETAVNKALDKQKLEFSEELKTYSEKIESLEGYLKEKDKEIVEFSTKLNAVEVEKDIDYLISKGKIKPSDKETEIKDFKEMKTFSEKLYKSRIEKVKKGENVIEFGEKTELNKDWNEEEMKHVSKEDAQKFGNMESFSLGGN